MKTLNYFLITLFLWTLSPIGANATTTDDKDEKALTVMAQQLFKDDLCTTLRDDISKKEIEACTNESLRNLALALYDRSYKQQFRVNAFPPVYSPEALGQLLHIGNGYSTYQHVTGIVLHPGEQMIIVEGLKDGSHLGVKVADLYAPNQGNKDWSLHSETYPLHNGVNIINKTTDWSGLAYMDYYFDHPENENSVKVHFVNADVNGYFDAALNTNEEWDELLANAIYPVFDAVGSNIQLAYPVKDLQKYAAGKGQELIGVYEELVSKQHEIIGWEKYNLVPNNKIFARVNYGYYMFRDGNGVAFKYDTMRRVADPVHLRTRDEDACWGFSHEVGHVHQLQSYLSWGGLGETSNNICTRYCTQALGYKNRLEKSFAKAENFFFENGKAGEVSKMRKDGGMKDDVIASTKDDPDHALSYLETEFFERLVPFWKLQCYFTQNGYPDFYPDLYQKMRNTEKEYPEFKHLNRHKNVVPFQFNFVRGASLVSGKNLYPYFEAYGFFRLLSLKYNDYGIYNYKLTKEMREEFKNELKELEEEGKIEPLTDEELNAMLYAKEK